MRKLGSTNHSGGVRGDRTRTRNQLTPLFSVNVTLHHKNERQRTPRPGKSIGADAPSAPRESADFRANLAAFGSLLGDLPRQTSAICPAISARWPAISARNSARSRLELGLRWPPQPDRASWSAAAPPRRTQGTTVAGSAAAGDGARSGDGHTAAMETQYIGVVDALGPRCRIIVE